MIDDARHDSEFEFRLITADDIPLLFEWLSRPHVSEWWGEEPIEEVRESYASKASAESSTRAYIVSRAGTPIGFIQSYVAAGSDGGWWTDIDDPGVRGIDQYLANADELGKGIGSAMIGAFVASLLDDPSVTRIITDPSPRNHRAIRCYEKVGFKRIGDITTPDGPAMLMVMDRPLASSGPSRT